MVFNKVGTKVIMNMREIFTVMNSTLAVVKISPLKKIQACARFEPTNSAIPMQFSTN